MSLSIYVYCIYIYPSGMYTQGYIYTCRQRERSKGKCTDHSVLYRPCVHNYKHIVYLCSTCVSLFFLYIYISMCSDLTYVGAWHCMYEYIFLSLSMYIFTCVYVDTHIDHWTILYLCTAYTLRKANNILLYSMCSMDSMDSMYLLSCTFYLSPCTYYLVPSLPSTTYTKYTQHVFVNTGVFLQNNLTLKGDFLKKTSATLDE